MSSMTIHASHCPSCGRRTLGVDDDDDSPTNTITRAGVRPFGPLRLCTFLRRIQHVEIHASLDLDNYLSRDLRHLEELFRHMKASRKATILRIELWDDGMPGVSEQQWRHILTRFEWLARRCRVIVQQHLARACTRERDLLEALNAR